MIGQILSICTMSASGMIDNEDDRTNTIARRHLQKGENPLKFLFYLKLRENCVIELGSVVEK